MGALKLTLIHDFDEEIQTYKDALEGWLVTLSGLKTVLETGQPLAVPAWLRRANKYKSILRVIGSFPVGGLPYPRRIGKIPARGSSTLLTFAKSTPFIARSLSLTS
ncbi:hypothetical protein ACFL4U_02265 [Candidatus Neomarinimicrobiota bacterium]